MEKNPTIVTFPVKNLELRDYVKVAADLGFPRCAGISLPSLASPAVCSSSACLHCGVLHRSDEEVSSMSVGDLKAIIRAHGMPLGDCLEKRDLVERVKADVLAKIITKCAPVHCCL